MKIQIDIQKEFNGFQLHSKFTGESDRIGILGASGCGKSMTLKAIAGIITPDQGKIIVNEQIYFDSNRKINIPPQKRKVGYLFQNYALFPTMTVEKNIATGLQGKRTDDRKKRVSLMIERFALNGLEKRYPAQLSGGQQQRVALARIMAYEPDVIMLDEPFSALDSFLKDSLKMEMKHLLDEYRGGMLMVSHSRDEIYEFSKQLLIMDCGHIIETGDTRELFQKPCSVETARLTGCKNIERVRRIDKNCVYVMDWDITLETLVEVSEDITHIGIRSHHIKYSKKKEKNGFRFEVIAQSETPFEYKYIVKKLGSDKGQLWWQVPKDGAEEVVGRENGFLYILPEDVMLLT
ncbi:sulfate/molybdate ABC transporter ATP-binding protein [Anaerosporobacter sp.]|uniref:sulfate/molybdate ABC transporter ATP-binding protein n=1 Tax=Anaerosporobacter sp. TaxID=1872529 RepID=UPI00286FA744|nr:ATP-binding cassette domain-containing protein [Anaerosporobacter sp.]